MLVHSVTQDLNSITFDQMRRNTDLKNNKYIFKRLAS